MSTTNTGVSKSGTAFVFTFSYPIIVDNKNPPILRTIAVNGIVYRFYPFFRSAPANFVPVPSVDRRKIPFLPGINVRISGSSEIRPLAVRPKLGLDEEGKASVHLDWGKEPTADTAKDSLRVDVIGDEARSDCVDLVENLMQHLRFASSQFWFGHYPLVGDLRVNFDIDSDGRPLGEPWSCGKGFTPSGAEKPITDGMWWESLQSLERSERSTFYRVLLLDGRFHAVTQDLRRSIIDSTTACEQARDMLATRLGINFNGTDLPKHLGTDLERLTDQKYSYCAASPDNFLSIQYLWRARNEVAHGKAARFHDGTRWIVVDSRVAMTLNKAAEHCIDWSENN